MPLKGFNSLTPTLLERIPPTDWYPSLAAAAIQSLLIQGQANYWLQLQGSLTRALQLRCHERFHVDVLREGFLRPTLEEACTLAVSPRQTVWVREVQLCGDGQPWVLARTVIPRTTLTGKARRLRHLGRKPLGAYLFRQPAWQRGPFQTGLCHPRENNRGPLVARRSRFYCGGHQLLVGEYFLSPLLHNQTD